MSQFKNNSPYLFLAFILFSISYAQTINTSSIPPSSQQLIVIVTDSISTTKGNLYRFSRDSANNDWEILDGESPVVVGRNGLGLGIGLHSQGVLNIPQKVEGDSKSPAGIFQLSSAFGYSPVKEMDSLKIPYIHITKMLECVDDIKSDYYNQIVNRNKIDKVDWQSSEEMRNYGVSYELGVVVDHNTNPVTKGGGSCIFMHNWTGPNDKTSGCTAMAPSAMKEIVYWLDAEKKPILVQLTKQLYISYRESWGLPQLNYKNNENN